MTNNIIKEIKAHLKQFKVSDLIQEDYCIYCSIPLEAAFNAIKTLHDNKEIAFTLLTDITAIDHLEGNKRFSIVYNLLSLKNNLRIIIKAPLSEEEIVPSISSIFKAAVWQEREIWDMFGIMFENCPDHRKILTDYGFTGHPLRKDFPVTGFKEVYYDNKQMKVVYKDVELAQEFRIYDNLTPWEGTQYLSSKEEEKLLHKEPSKK